MTRERTSPDSGPSPEQFAAFLDGELEAASRARVEAWLAKHPAVAEEIEGQRRVVRLWQAEVPTEPSLAAWTAVFGRIEAKLRPVSPRQRTLRRTLWLVAPLAAAVLTAVLLTRQFRPGPTTTQSSGIASRDGFVLSADGADQEPILLASQDDVSVVSVESYWQDDGRVPSIGEGDVSMIVAAPLAATREP